ncbi:DUF1328 domain-containing protein [Paraflavitalea soli]|uniref:DUF1328 domain-containing protein n=1 Tax=Paraflavitalea soli TaxID=2315862 RepID=A0A3B7MYS7_9BACT|nr:DUF1328 domain-containing protein [Paraflavitalea soli]AXY78369.1 DUF1328 domain-containing protein [Paraflavitalea soli]
MLRWSEIFLIMALIASLCGFGGMMGGDPTIAKILFFIFTFLFIASVVNRRQTRNAK